MIKNVFMKHEIRISDEQEDKLKKYYDLLMEWNKKINLTAITEYEEVVYKHFLDSALIMNNPIFTETKAISVLDLGTGAGFPGVVLAILCPESSFILVDSLNKRIEFLHIIKRQLHLDNIELFHGRAEDLARQDMFRNQFDFVVSRAVAELPILLEYCIPFLKKGGYFISYKGKKYQEEIDHSFNALQKLNAEVKKVEEYKLYGEDRSLIMIVNKSLTNDKYPRKAGKIKKYPL